MPERADQAEGLRRLLAREFMRIVAFHAGEAGVGKTATVVNLAHALARGGSRVLVVDENTDAGNAAAQLGLRPRCDLLHVLTGERSLAEVALPGPPGITLLPACRGVRALADAGPAEIRRLTEAFARPPAPWDVALVDAAPGAGSGFLPLAGCDHERVLVVSPRASAITGGYALVKAVGRAYGAARFRVLVARTARDGEAQAVFGNLRDTARRHLGAELEWLGQVPADVQGGRLATAACERVAEAIGGWPCPRERTGIAGLLRHLTGRASGMPFAFSMTG